MQHGSPEVQTSAMFQSKEQPQGDKELCREAGTGFYRTEMRSHGNDVSMLWDAQMWWGFCMMGRGETRPGRAVYGRPRHTMQRVLRFYNRILSRALGALSGCPDLSSSPISG